jgi:hypothetical protein
MTRSSMRRERSQSIVSGALQRRSQYKTVKLTDGASDRETGNSSRRRSAKRLRSFAAPRSQRRCWPPRPVGSSGRVSAGALPWSDARTPPTRPTSSNRCRVERVEARIVELIAGADGDELARTAAPCGFRLTQSRTTPPAPPDRAPLRGPPRRRVRGESHSLDPS